MAPESDHESEEDNEVEPWDEDPVKQLPPMIEPGRISLVLWSARSSESAKAYDVIFDWDGGRKAEW